MPAEISPIDGACGHCGYVHHKRSGHLKYYVAALQCPIYVELLLDEMDSWGVAPRSRGRGDETQDRGFSCHAPGSFVCYHKGSPSGRDALPACMSPDGFSTQVKQQDKVRLVKTEVGKLDFELGVYGDEDERWTIDEGKLCEHRAPERRRRRKRSGEEPQPRAKPQKGHKIPAGNRMPGAGDWRKQRVMTVLQRRIDFLSGRGWTPTPERIAKLGGFTERKAS